MCPKCLQISMIPFQNYPEKYFNNDLSNLFCLLVEWTELGLYTREEHDLVRHPAQFLSWGEEVVVELGRNL
jgi:hypothetical protein